jgi:hypothetical protein
MRKAPHKLTAPAAPLAEDALPPDWFPELPPPPASAPALAAATEEQLPPAWFPELGRAASSGRRVHFVS